MNVGRPDEQHIMSHGRPGQLRSAVLALMATAFIYISPADAAAGTMPEHLIMQSVDEHTLVTLAGNTRPEAVARNDRGAVSDDLKLEHIYLLIKRSAAQEKAAAELFDELHDRTSSRYHQWLTSGEVAQRFGPSSDDVATLTNWLGAHGFTVHNVYTANGVIDFGGSAGAVREAFHTEIHHLSVNGQAHIANISDPQIPAALAAAIHGIVSLHDFRPPPALKRRAGKVPSASFDIGGNGFAVVPGDLQKIYNMTPLYERRISGQG